MGTEGGGAGGTARRGSGWHRAEDGTERCAGVGSAAARLSERTHLDLPRAAQVLATEEPGGPISLADALVGDVARAHQRALAEAARWGLWRLDSSVRLRLMLLVRIAVLVIQIDLLRSRRGCVCASQGHRADHISAVALVHQVRVLLRRHDEHVQALAAWG